MKIEGRYEKNEMVVCDEIKSKIKKHIIDDDKW